MPSTDSLDYTIAEIDNFVSQRDWEQFHTVKNLVASISIEAAELSETVQWTNPTKDEVLQDERLVQSISHELADVMVYCLNLCSKLELDPIQIIEQKLTFHLKLKLHQIFLLLVLNIKIKQCLFDLF